MEQPSGKASMEMALELGKKLNQAFLSLHALAKAHSDAYMSHFLRKEFLTQRVSYPGQ